MAEPFGADGREGSREQDEVNEETFLFAALMD
jgi:hypothetical protein